jgi:hypothetical protein
VLEAVRDILPPGDKAWSALFLVEPAAVGSYNHQLLLIIFSYLEVFFHVFLLF